MNNKERKITKIIYRYLNKLKGLLLHSFKYFYNQAIEYRKIIMSTFVFLTIICIFFAAFNLQTLYFKYFTLSNIKNPLIHIILLDDNDNKYEGYIELYEDEAPQAAAILQSYISELNEKEIPVEKTIAGMLDVDLPISYKKRIPVEKSNHQFKAKYSIGMKRNFRTKFSEPGKIFITNFNFDLPYDLSEISNIGYLHVNQDINLSKIKYLKFG